jgi:parallel beta-helix repeat protein
MKAIGGEIASQDLNDNFSELDSTKVGKESLLFFNASDYGASGDGIADDTLALQTVIDEAANETATTMVKVEKGVYRVTQEIILKDGVILDFHPGAEIKREHDGYMFKNWLSGDTPSGYTGRGNIRITNGIFNQNGFNYPAQASCMIFAHAENIQVEGVTILNASNSHAIEFNACKDINVQKSRFIGLNNTLGSTIVEAVQFDLAKAGPLEPYDNTTCKNATIENNYFEGWVRGVGSHSSTIDVWHENITISNNIFKDLTGWAIRPYSWKKVHVINNKILNCVGGIVVYTPLSTSASDSTNASGTVTNASQPCSYFNISGNQIVGGLTDGNGIQLYGDSTGRVELVNITDNEIDASNGTREGIFVRYADSCNIEGNIVKGVNASGITVSSSIYTNVTNNTIQFVEGNGIYCTTDVDYGSIVGNNIRSVGENGIFVRDESNNISISGNVVTGVNGTGAGAQNIRVTTNVTKVAVSGNICANASGYTGTAAFEATSTVTNMVRTGNIFVGLAVNDASGSLVTGDLI